MGLNMNQKAEVITHCWAIWHARNDLVWNKKVSMVNKVVALSKEYLTQWKEAQSRTTTALLQPMFEGDGAQVWVKPQGNTVKITVDAAMFEDLNTYGIGLIARDSTGELIRAKTRSLKAKRVQI